MDKKLRIAIVGCGGMGSGHAVALQSGTGETVYKGNVADAKMPDSAMTTNLGEIVELAGITDIDPARAEWADSQGIFVYASYQEMLTDKTVNAILIATPNHLHKPMAVEALQAGKHVLCEKPVMLSSADLLDVLEVANKANKVFYPRQNREWDEDFLIIKKIYEENKIPKGSLQIWSSNGNGVDLEENCEENKRYYLTKEEYAKLRYENININQVGPIGCPNKNKKEFELEPENKAIYQFIQELQKQEGTIIYISYHSTGGLIYYRSHCEKQKKQEFNRKLALDYQEKTDYTMMEEEKENCNEAIMRNLVDGHIKIELSPMGGNPIGPYGDIKGNYLPTIQKNIEALKYILEKIF